MEKIKTVEMHTGGEPVRIIVSGYPPIKGATILEQRRYAKEHFDNLRTMLMAEPRGHLDMYGALLVEKTHPQADMAVLFLHNEGYSTMCGHACISLGRYALDYKLVKPVSPETVVNVQCPCGIVQLHVQYDTKTGKSGIVRFHSIPSYAFAVNKVIQIDGLGEVKYDISYGGAFYALVDVHQLNMDFKTTPLQQLEQVATSISKAVRSEVKITHPENDDLAFLYGTILTDGKDDMSTQNLCVFADHQVDRSPCGSGVCARTAVQYHKGLTKLGLKKNFVNGKTETVMSAMAIRVEPYCGYSDAVVVEVSGHGYYTGEATFIVEEDDPLANGFIIN